MCLKLPRLRVYAFGQSESRINFGQEHEKSGIITSSQIPRIEKDCYIRSFHEKDRPSNQSWKKHEDSGRN